MGILITYSSYFNNKTHLIKTAGTVAILDTTVAILAGVIIFPAVFLLWCGSCRRSRSCICHPPQCIQSNAGICVMVCIVFLTPHCGSSYFHRFSFSKLQLHFLSTMHLSRKKATRTMMIIVAILSTICSLSIGSWSHIRIFGKTIFDACDYFSAIILLPIGGLLISIFIGWILKRNISREELTNRNKLHEPLFNAIFFCIKYIAPIIIILIFLSGFGII